MSSVEWVEIIEPRTKVTNLSIILQDIACKIITNFMFSSFLFAGARTNLIECKKMCHSLSSVFTLNSFNPLVLIIQMEEGLV